MFIQPAIVSFITLAGFAASQTVDPASIDKGSKKQWCVAQRSSCPLICLQNEDADGVPSSNTCDEDTLAFSCVCSNGVQPNATEFSQTIPFFLCSKKNGICVDNCNGDSGCQSDCRENHRCGAQNPTRVTRTSSLSSATASSTGNPTDTVYDGFGEESATDGSSAAGRLAVSIGQMYGLGIMVTGFLAGFTMLL